jgi:hypothetical protein
MAIREAPTLVDFDAQAALEAGLAVADDGLLTAVEYVGADLHPLYVADAIEAMYDDRAHMESHFDTIAQNRHVDAHEKDLFEQELTDLGRVEFFVTRMDFAAFGRLVAEEGQGLWVSLDPDVPVVETMEAMRAAVTDEEPEPLYDA